MFKGQMAGDTVKWPILRDSAAGTDILITKSPSSSMGEKNTRKPFWLVHYDNIQRTKITCLCAYPPKENKEKYGVPLSPWAPIDFLKLKEMGKCYEKKKKWAMSFFVWHLPRKSPKSEIINELSPVNTNIPLTVSNSQT